MCIGNLLKDTVEESGEPYITVVYNLFWTHKVPYLYQILKFINREPCFFYDITKSSFLDFLMKWNNYRYVFLKIVHKDMASSLMVNDEPLSPEYLDNVFA